MVSWRRRFARWRARTPGVDTGDVPPPDVAEADQTPDPWPLVCEQFALRVLSLAEVMRGELDKLEADEQDPETLERLYQVDHAATRVQRLAENLQVLTGRRTGEPHGRVTSLLDVIRAAMSAIEHYSRVEIGGVAPLALVEYAADDVANLLAELLDNATRYSPPTSVVTVSAHLTEQGSVLLRVEDEGIGVDRATLDVLDKELPWGGSSAAGAGDPLVAANHLALEAPGHFGLAVVRRLAHTHAIQVRLEQRRPTGVVAMVLLPVRLLCEVPGRRLHRAPGVEPPVARSAPSPTPITRDRSRPLPRPRRTPVQEAPQPAPVDTDVPPKMSSGLPRRVPGSIRDRSEPRTDDTSKQLDEDTGALSWHDDVAAFVAGEEAARNSDDRTDPAHHRSEGQAT